MNLSVEKEKIFRQYIATALWTSEDDPEILEGASIDDISNETQTKAREDISAFVRLASSQQGIDLSTMDAEQIGHDFWLTRNGHGSGFWDRQYDNDQAGTLGARLSAVAEEFVHLDVVMGDDGKIYFE